MSKRFFLLSLYGFCIGTVTQAQQFDRKHLSVEGQVSFGNMAKVDSEVKDVLLNKNLRFFDISLNYNTLPSDSSRFASIYNYPVFGLGLSIADFSNVCLTNQSSINNIYTLYGFIDRSLIRTNQLSFGYKLSAGLSYASNPYDPIKNPDNIFVSSPLMVYIGFGLNAKYKLTNQFAIGLSVEARHFSNGRLGMPNKGINILAAGVSASYFFDTQPSVYPKMQQKEEYKNHFYYHFVLGGGLQSSLEEWNLYSVAETDPDKKKKDFKKYPKFSFSGDAMYRYSRKYGTGVGVDVFYVPHTNKLKEWDAELLNGNTSLRYNPLSIGISLNQEVFYKNASLFAAFGYYAYRELGEQNKESRFYQRAGFRYYIPPSNNIFFGASIKAHNFRMAEYLELSVGYKF